MKKENHMLKITSVVLLFCMIFAMTHTSTVYAASLYEHCPIQAYPLVDKAITYDLITGQKCGYAAKTDLCKILRIFDEDELVLEYPLDSGGTKTARVKIKDFFLDSDLDSRSLVNIGKNLTVYKDKACTKTFGKIYIADNILIINVDHANNVTQVLYQITGTSSWKMGFVRGVYDPDSGFEKVDIEEGYYMIFSSTNPSFGIDVYRAYTDNGANLQLYRRQNSANQVFVILKYNDGYVIFCYHADSKVWDVDLSNGNVLQWYFHGGENQIWDAFRTPSGEIVFKNRGNSKYLDVSNNVMADEVNIGTHFFNNSSAEKFILQPVTINGAPYNGEIQLNDNSSNKESTNNSSAQAVSNRLNALINTYKGTQWNGYYMGTQCKGFANLIFQKLFNVYIGAYDEGTKSYIPYPDKGVTEVGRLTTSTMSLDACKELLLKAQPGDYIQVRRRGKTYGHSMIVVDTSASGITVFDCNSDGRNGVKVYDINYSSFYSSNSAMSLYHAKDYK